MQLTRFTDASLRVLMHLARQSGVLATTSDIAQLYGVPFNHLIKAVNHLSRSGWVQGSRGRGGGLKLAVPASEIVLGAVVRSTEPTMAVIECFTPACPLRLNCELQRALHSATQAFYQVLDQYTLADLAQNTSLLGVDLLPSQGPVPGSGRATPQLSVDGGQAPVDDGDSVELSKVTRKRLG